MYHQIDATSVFFRSMALYFCTDPKKIKWKLLGDYFVRAPRKKSPPLQPISKWSTFITGMKKVVILHFQVIKVLHFEIGLGVGPLFGGVPAQSSRREAST